VPSRRCKVCRLKEDGTWAGRGMCAASVGVLERIREAHAGSAKGPDHPDLEDRIARYTDLAGKRKPLFGED
jgi:hypothetical protein